MHLKTFMNRHVSIILWIIILAISFFLRFYNLEEIPNGLWVDEAVQGYNAYSLLLTGKDEYGKSFPVFFRSFGNFQSPLYTYLSIPSIYFFDLTVFATRILSVLAGCLTVLLTFFVVKEIKINKSNQLALLATLIVAISPWAIFFSRIALESNLALTLVILGTLILIKSLKNPKLLIVAAGVLALSTYAYHAERILAILLFFGFLLLFRKNFLNNRKAVLFSIILFILIHIPQLELITSAGANSRINQVNYWSDNYFDQNGGAYKDIIFGKYFFIVKKFASQYTTYLSPTNLFFRPDDQEVLSMPDMSIFYTWMIIPIIFGIRAVFKNRSDNTVKTLILLLLLSPIPASLTREPFYTLRTLSLFWVISLVISFGIFEILQKIRKRIFQFSLICLILLISTVQFYISYFILFKYERSEAFGAPYIELIRKTKELSFKDFLLDSQRTPSIYILIAFFRKYDPSLLQASISDKILNNYYTDVQFSENRIVNLDNIRTMPIRWEDEIYEDKIIVGDLLAISDQQVEEHKLTLLFDIKNVDGEVVLRAFQTNPTKKCKEGTVPSGIRENPCIKKG